MNDLISRKALLAEYDRVHIGEPGKARKLIEDAPAVREWIPVSERLPDWRDEKVLVFTKYGFSICERTVNGRWKGQHANWISHWMPLPEPPKGE